MNQRGQMMQMENLSTTASNKEFVVNGISNQFSGIADYSGETETQTNENTEAATAESSNSNTLSNILSNKVAIAAIAGGTLILVVAIIALIVILVAGYFCI